ncbi:hypothetical protein BJ170DRAFT_273420 [Xylariales sp. AK1849]|nr:hypothetical protein BJ170DRAFT_273420 [Xylariales sp. AK1849]
MAPKLLILTGAPDNSMLDWDTDELLNAWMEPVARFARLYGFPQLNTTTTDDSVLGAALWRSIPLERTRLPTGFSQVHELDRDFRGTPEFYTTLTRPFGATPETRPGGEESQRLLEEFYHHSLRVHVEIPSSQLPTSSLSTNESSFLTTSLSNSGPSFPSTSFSDGRSADIRTSLSRADRTLELGTSHLSDLEDLPNAAYLHSISPQTMSVNLIVGVISIAEPRTIKTRWGATKSLVELIVGDETKAGFSITFWLSSDAAGKGNAEDSPDHSLRTLRRQDIVLLQNVGLSDFNKTVHGHSLRKNLTKINILYRRKLDDEDIGGFYSTKDLTANKHAHPQLSKTRRVREWVLKFVGGDYVQLGKRKEEGKAVRSWELPPEDTQI